MSSTAPELLEVTGVSAAQIGERARDLHIVLHELTPQRASLEEAFMDMTRDEVEYHAAITPSTTASRSAA